MIIIRFQIIFDEATELYFVCVTTRLADFFSLFSMVKLGVRGLGSYLRYLLRGVVKHCTEPACLRILHFSLLAESRTITDVYPKISACQEVRPPMLL